MKTLSRITFRILSYIFLLCLSLTQAQAGATGSGISDFDTWPAWVARNPLSSAQRDKAEEALLIELSARHTFAEIREALVEREWRRDYLQLAGQIGNREHWKRVAPTAFRQTALVRESDRDPLDIVLRTTRALLDDLKQSASSKNWAAMEAKLDSLAVRGSTVDPGRLKERFDIFRQVCALRRRMALANPLLDFRSLLFAKRRLATANHMCDQYFGNFARPGGGLFVLEEPFGQAPTVRDLLAHSMVKNGRLQGKRLEGGSFLQPALSYDGLTVVFAYSACGLSEESSDTGGQLKDPPWSVEMVERPPWTTETSYHIFRVNLDGSELVQLTDGPWNDLHPNWLPDGRMVYISERRGGFGRCHGRPVPLYTLHSMDAHGRNLQRLSYHEGNEWHPSVNNEGLIVYSRWDYVDRGHNQAHHPWLTTPDGRDARALHGNFKPTHDLNPDMELNVVAIPGSHRYVATASAHHTQAYGSLIIIDPQVPDDDAMAPVRRLTPEVGLPETFERGGAIYGTVWPLSEHYYMCVYSPTGDRHGLYLLDAFGNRELVYRDPAIGCLGPVAVKSRALPPLVPAVGEPARLSEQPEYQSVGDEHPLDPADAGTKDLAVVGVVNVYHSLHPYPKDVKIVALRIVHLLPKSTPLHHQPQIGYGSETSARSVLGIVPVEEDGSAYFYLPPGKPVYFQALDERGCAVQSMRSATYVHGGGRLFCTGCHQPTSQVSLGTRLNPPKAFRRDPSSLQSEPEGSHPFSFPRLVQPVLNQHCVKCHAEKTNLTLDLRPGNWQRDKFSWYQSYRNLQPFAFHYGAPRKDSVANQYDFWQPARTVPGKFGARASRLLTLLDQDHYGVKLSSNELRRIIVWLDLNSDFFGAYEQVALQARGELVQPKLQ